MTRARFAIIITSVVACGCSKREHDPIYDEMVEALDEFEHRAEQFQVVPSPWSRYPYTSVESQDGSTCWDWRPKWDEIREPVDKQLRYAESTGRLSWRQLTDLRQRLSTIDATVSDRVREHQFETLRRLEAAQKSTLEWIRTAEFDTSLKYEGSYLSINKGARRQLLDSHFGEGASWFTCVDACWVLWGTNAYLRQRDERLHQEVEWALWERFAGQKGIDVWLMSSYLDEFGLGGWWGFDAFKERFRQFPPEKVAMVKMVKNDLAPKPWLGELKPLGERREEIPSPPEHVVTAILSSSAGARAVIAPDVLSIGGHRGSMVVQVGDVLRFKDIDWQVSSIDPVDRSVVVIERESGASHVFKAAE